MTEKASGNDIIMNEEQNEVQKSVFETLYANTNVQEHVKKKGQLSYLSWTWAWAEVKKAYPGAFYTIYENRDGLFYHTDGKTAWVKTGVTINGLEHIEYLPVMNHQNVSITLDKLTSADVNKAIQRSITKACARHGLGLFIYAGEDLPEVEKEAQATAELDQAIAEVKAVSSRAEFEVCVRKWQAKLKKRQACAKFNAAAQEVAKIYPKPTR